MPMRIPLQQDLDTLQATLMEEGDLCARASAAPCRRCASATPSWPTRSSPSTTRSIRATSRSRWPSSRCSPGRRRSRPTCGSCSSIIHINLALERIADLAVTIAKLTKLVYAVPPDTKLIEAYDEMATRGEEMLKLSLDAFMNRDVEAAESLVELDELIDRANRRAVHHLMAIGSNPEMREWGLRMIIVSRCLERIGDHCVDIGEQIAYLVTGEFREFTDASTELRG